MENDIKLQAINEYLHYILWSINGSKNQQSFLQHLNGNSFIAKVLTLKCQIQLQKIV